MMLERDDVVDLLVDGDQSLVLTSTSCIRLTAVPTRIVEILSTPRSTSDLADLLAAQFGEPPRGRVEEVIEDLVQARVVRRRDHAGRSD